MYIRHHRLGDDTVEDDLLSRKRLTFQDPNQVEGDHTKISQVQSLVGKFSDDMQASTTRMSTKVRLVHHKNSSPEESKES
jgi:hypothetical protein